MGRIGIFGGTFNPPHRGHMLAAREFAAKLGLDLLLLVPDAVPPHKALPAGTPDPETRLRLCRLAAAGIPGVEVSPLEIAREGTSYTAETVADLRRLYPQDELILLMGTDMFLSFDQWREPGAICRNAALAMAFRRDPPEAERAAVLAQKERLEREFGASVTLVQNDFYEVSSSSVRRLLAYGGGESEIPAEVFREIRRLGLYRTGETWKNLPFDALRTVSLSLHRERRRAHAEGCCATARRLAARYGEDPDAAARAGILHDVTKALNGAEQLILCKNYGIILDQFNKENDKLLHAVTGAAVAARLFGESEQVCGGIRWHTTGRAGMSRFEKIIYLADLIEPTRDFPGVDELRALAERDLDEAMLAALERTVSFVEEGGSVLHPDSVHALEWQRAQMKQPASSAAPSNEVNK